MEVRGLRLSDVPDLLELVATLGYPSNSEQVSQQLAKLLTDDTHYLIGAEQDGRVVGFLDGQVYETIYSPRGFNVLGLAVLPVYQGQGIGKALLQALETEARQRAYAFIRLNSGSHRTGEHAFYQACGYDGNKSQRRFYKEIGETNDF